MIKKILLDYVMGKYRKYILAILMVICIVSIILHFLNSTLLDIEGILIVVLGYFAFIIFTNKGAIPPGIPAIDHNSNMFFIYLRIFIIIVFLWYFFNILYEISFLS